MIYGMNAGLLLMLVMSAIICVISVYIGFFSK